MVHELEFVEIAADSGLISGTIQVVSDGDTVDLTAAVDAAAMVVLSVEDLASGVVTARHDPNQVASATLER